MSIRSELEGKLTAFCNAQVPKIPVAKQGMPFTKPADGSRFVKCWMMPKQITNPTVDGLRERERSFMQITVCCPDGNGTKEIETLAFQIAALYPIAPKELFTEVSIEQSAQIGQIFVEDDAPHICLPITIRYRQER